MSIRYVFSINTGRSGSDYLTSLFARAANAISIHEGLPIMNGTPMQAWNNGDPGPLEALMPLKLGEIRKQQRRRPDAVYCETVHSFIKGWGWLLPDRWIAQDEMAVIVLRREPERIAQSLLRTHHVPGLSRWANTWYLRPGSMRDLCAPPTSGEPIEACRWYVREVEARALAYQRQFPRIRYFDCSLEQLNQPEFVQRLFSALGLRATPELMQVCGHAANQMSEFPPIDPVALAASANRISADSLDCRQTEALVGEMVDLIQREQAEALLKLRQSVPVGAPLAPELAGLVVRLQAELEARFDYRIAHTEFESGLVLRLLQAVDPLDLMWLFVFPDEEARTDPGGLGQPLYRYDFNRVPRLRSLLRRFGPRVLPRLIRLALNRHSLQDDRTHHDALVA